MCSNVFRRRDPSEAWVASRAVEDLRTPARAPQRSDGPTCMLRDRPPKHTWSSFCDDESEGHAGAHQGNPSPFRATRTISQTEATPAALVRSYPSLLYCPPGGVSKSGQSPRVDIDGGRGWPLSTLTIGFRGEARGPRSVSRSSVDARRAVGEMPPRQAHERRSRGTSDSQSSR